LGKFLQLPYANEAKFGLNMHGLSSRKRHPLVSDHIGLAFWVVDYGRLDCYIRGLKKRRWQRRGRHLVKSELCFTREIRDCLDQFIAPRALKTCSGKICNGSVQFQREIRKISHRRLRSSGYVGLGRLATPSSCCMWFHWFRLWKIRSWTLIPVTFQHRTSSEQQLQDILVKKGIDTTSGDFVARSIASRPSQRRFAT